MGTDLLSSYYRKERFVSGRRGGKLRITDYKILNQLSQMIGEEYDAGYVHREPDSLLSISLRLAACVIAAGDCLEQEARQAGPKL